MTRGGADVIGDVLQRLDVWLARHRLRYLAGLNPPATAAELAALSAKLARPVPDDLQALLRWHNGQGQEFIGAFEQSWLLMSCQSIVANRELLNLDAAATGWRTTWIPFLDDDAGDFLCLDDAGAVRAFWLGNQDHPVVAPSLSAWLDDFVSHVEQGHYTEDPERGHFVRSE
jgi:cell wall assembly regulator SMI1